MIEVVWRYAPDAASPSRPIPATATEAEHLLLDGNRAYADVIRQAETGTAEARVIVNLSANDLGLAAGDAYPIQSPFAAVLGCADARVPVEMIWLQQANDLFVVRVAGNSLGTHGLGSLDYAITHLPSLRLLVVLGHTGCGAVTAAVDSYLRPVSYMGLAADMPLRAIVDSIMTAVVGAAEVLRRAYGDDVRERPDYRTALIELSVILNAAVTAISVRETFRHKLSPQQTVVYGIYNLGNHLVGLPDDAASAAGWLAGLREPPATAADLTDLALALARSGWIARRLAG